MVIHEIDYAAFELGMARPRLRDDLQFSYRQSSHGPFYLIEDETNSKFYRVGIAEYTFLSLLDGKTTVQSAVAATAVKLGIEAFTEAEAAAVCKWLIDANLADKKRHDARSWQEAQDRRKLAERLQWVNPIMLKLPLGNPDRQVTSLTQLVGWLVHGYVGLALVALLITAAMFGFAHRDELQMHRTVFSQSNWLWLASAWLGLRVLHESAHAVVCKRFGGRVREWGVLLLMFIPLPYVDVTTAWRFPSRRARILTSAAGMLAEAFVAAVATLIWCHTESALVRQHAFNVMLAGAFTTLVFNANPLMRFDGYHILADLLDAPNLWTHGRQYVLGLGRRCFFGINSGKPPWRPSEARLIKCYGLASSVWKVLITISLILAALSVLEGVGVVLAVIAASLWIGVPGYRLAHFICRGTDTEQPDRRRFAVVSLALGTSAVVAGTVLPAPTVVSAPIVVQHDPLFVVRNKAAGFVVDLPVKSGQSVSRNDVICRLENADLLAQVEDVRLQLQESRQRLRAYQSFGEAAAVQIESEATADLEQRLTELKQLAGQLTIVAPLDGVVVSEVSAERVGSYLKPGSEIVSIAGGTKLKAIGLVPQDVSESCQHLSTDARIKIWGVAGGSVAGRVKKVAPRAQTTLPHFSFAVPAGGSLAVVETQSVGQAADHHESSWKLAKPHVGIEIELENSERRVLAGQTGIVLIRAANGALGPYLLSRLSRFVRDRITRNHGI